MNIAGRLPLIVVVLVSYFAVSVSPSVAQKFLGYSRNRCNGEVKVPGHGLAIGQRRSQTIVVKRGEQSPSGKVPIKWQCVDEQQRTVTRTVNCPAGTGKVTFDRTQGGVLLTIICLKR